MYKINEEKNGEVISVKDTAGQFSSIPVGGRDWRKSVQPWLDLGNELLPMDIPDPWIAKRIERDLILQSCDWTQGADSQLSAETVAAWATYRQALRDLPATYPNGDDIAWPDTPA